MKTYKIIIAAFATMFTLGSCSDFLTTELTDKKTSDNYYKTPGDAYTSLVGCYNGLDLLWNAGIAFPVASEVLSDNCFGGTGSSDGYSYQMIDQFDKSISTSDASMYELNWKAYYQAIYRCNILLSKLDQVDWGTQSSMKTTYEAETKFIRAYLYFDLVRLFEKVPLLTAVNTAVVPQSEPIETYKQIMSDLRFSVDNMKDTVYTATPSGRATKWAAESLLARVYLFYSGYYGATEIGGETQATALTALEDVIAHSGHGLVDDFTTLWPAASNAKAVTYAGEDNKEVVFSIKYTGNADYKGNITGNSWLVMTGIRGTLDPYVYPYGYGWGACTVDPKLWNTFVSKDSRRFASITSITNEDLTGSYTAKVTADNREYTGYYLKKYSPRCDKSGNIIPAISYTIAQPQDYFVIRYSDVLLMAAELGSANAQQYLTDVHSRAGLTDVVAPTKANILAERRLEFVGEGIRYWDLLRQGLATAATEIVNNTTLTKLDSRFPNLRVSDITATRGFQQIPDNQITLSGGLLLQNPGW